MANKFFHIYNIDWDTHDYEEYGYSSDPITELPTEYLIPYDDLREYVEDEDEDWEYWLDEKILDILGDEVGWLVDGFEKEVVYEEED